MNFITCLDTSSPGDHQLTISPLYILSPSSAGFKLTMTLQPEMLLLAFLASLICVKAFMPNYVFPFQPNTNSQSHQTITDEDVDLIGYNVDSFYPTETKDGLIDDGSLTHKDITRLGCLRAVARFYEERLRKTSGSLEKINPLTSETLLRTVFGNHTSTKNFELALQEIETQAALMDAWYETNENVTEELSIARQHFDDESFEEGQAYLWGLSKALFIALTKESYSSARTFSGRFLLTMQDFYAHSNWVELKQGLGQTEILEELGQRPPSTTQFLKNVAGITRGHSCQHDIHLNAVYSVPHRSFPANLYRLQPLL